MAYQAVPDSRSYGSQPMPAIRHVTFSSNPRPQAEPLWQVPALLLAQRYAEAQRLLSAALQRLETDGVAGIEFTPLSRAVLQTLRTLPRLSVSSQQQQQLGFVASGLVASIAAKTVDVLSLYKKFRGLLKEAVRLCTFAWHPRSGLVNQHIDNNRFVLRLCATLAAKERDVRYDLTELVANCITAPQAQFWFANFFASNLQGALAVFAHGSLADGCAPSRLSLSLLQHCHREFSLELLERVLLFLTTWSSHVPRGRPLSGRWLSAAQELLQGRSERVALTPAAYFVVFFLGTRGWDQGKSPPSAHESVVTWIRAGLQDNFASQEALALRGCVASQDLTSIATAEEDWWAVPAEALRVLICDVLLPAWLMDYGPAELEGHRDSAITRVLPDAAVALARCLSNLQGDAQARLVMRPLEELSCAWCERCCLLSEEERENPARQWFGAAVFFLIGTVARSVDLVELQPMALLHCIRSLAHADVFRQDTQEYRALCLSVVECGAESSIFAESLLKAPEEFYRQYIIAAVGSGEAYAHLSRLHFLLGVLACPKLIESPHFFPAVWPVVVKCVSGASGTGEEQLTIAVRAHALACICFGEAGTSGLSESIREYLSSSIEAVGSISDDALYGVLLSSVDALACDVATQCSHLEEGALKLQHWMWQTLGTGVRRQLDDGNAKVAEGLFKVLCGAACHVDPDLLPEPFYSDSHLQSLLLAHPPLRELWLKFLISRFPEKSKEVLAFCILQDFPDSAAAFPAEGARGSSGKSPPRSAL